MVSKFLIDECLSPALALLARDRGFVESSHVTWLGKSGWKDWELKEFILAGDWTFVTRNSVVSAGQSSHLAYRVNMLAFPYMQASFALTDRRK